MVCDVKTISNDGAIVKRLGFSRRFNRTKEATEQCRKTAIGNARRCRQDLIGREGYTKGVTKQCRKTPIGNTRSRRTGPYRSREGFHIAGNLP